MALSSGNIYSIPEHPAEEDLQEKRYRELALSPKERNGGKKLSSVSLPENSCNLQQTDIERKQNRIPTLIASKDYGEDYRIASGIGSNQHYHNRLSVSLVDFSNIRTVAGIAIAQTDKKNASANMKSPHLNSGNNSKSYQNIQDCASLPNEYETLLSPTANLNCEPKSDRLNHGSRKKKRKESENLIFIDLNQDEEGYQSVVEKPAAPSVSRQRSGSMQWIQSTFQNISNKYRSILDHRRPSDIAEERMRKSNEAVDMEESESEATTDNKPSSNASSRRFSENVTGKHKKLHFVARLGHLKGLWKDKHLASKRQEEKDNDQTRTDVCPLFTFPRKQQEDELILDAVSSF